MRERTRRLTLTYVFGAVMSIFGGHATADELTLGWEERDGTDVLVDALGEIARDEPRRRHPAERHDERGQ